MTYGVIVHVQAPVQMYDRLHSELLQVTTAPVEGLLLHIGRPTTAGFDVIEVWESQEQCDHYNRELIDPVVARLMGRPPLPSEIPDVEEFEVRGLLIPSAGLAT